MKTILWNIYTILLSRYSRVKGGGGLRGGGLPTGNLSNDINAVLTSEITEVGNHCCHNDLLKEEAPQFR